MFYLLPPEHKKALLNQYRMRLTFVILISLSCLLVIASGLLFPSFLSIGSKEQEINSEKKIIDQLIEKKSGNNLKETLLDLKKNISILSTDDPKVFNVINLVGNSKTSGIHVTKFSYVFAADSKSTLIISGIADSRPELISFSKNLQAHPEFKKVNLPISNLAKDSNISFSINITGAF